MKRSEFLRLTTLTTGTLVMGGMGSLFMVERADAAESVAGTLYPYLQTPQPDSIWVSWWTNTEADTIVEIGTSADLLDRTINGGIQVLGVNFTYHSAKIDGLQPSTYYYYRVRSGSQISAVHRFRTSPPVGTKTGKYRILVIGDNQILSAERRWEKMVARAKTKIEEKFGVPIEEAVDFILNVGDQVDVGTLDHYRNLHFDYGKLITPNLASMTIIGNHETYYDSGMALYKSIFYYDDLRYQGIASPGGDTYYAQQQANILIVHLNSEDTSNAQREWVRQVVNAVKTDASVDFMISLVHRPYQAEQYVGDISGWFRSQIMPILSETDKHVLNIGAHHHLYARGQTRDWPCYHIISGASAWDQFWGQSNEVNFDDVQKTVANWAWQLLEFDLDAGRMDATCYAEAHVKIPESERWTTRAYDSRVIDTFHRQPALPAPTAPTFANAISGVQTLPLTLISSPFATTTGELLNSAQFQIAKDNAFTNLKVDLIRDFENLYGDTGAPNYEPVDTHASVDILRYTVAEQGLQNGSYFARVRHRDRNIAWSGWSPVASFQVTGSIEGEPKISIAKRVFTFGEDVTVNFEFSPGVVTDWIGVYKKGQNPGSPVSTDWAYLNGSRTAPSQPVASGSLTLRTDFAAGTEWYAAFMTKDGYTEVAPRVPFYVGTIPLLASDKAAYAEGDAVGINFTGAPGIGTKDWIGLYRVGQTPGPNASTQWSYVTGTAGFKSFSNLAAGYYFATFLVNDGTFEIAERIYFSVGNEIANCTMPKTTMIGQEDFDIEFDGGPGTAKDYIGIFHAGATPGIDKLVTYLYVDGRTTGSVRVTEDFPPGNYFAALYINDSYTAVSNTVDFTIAERPAFAIEEARLEGNEMKLVFSSESGVGYKLWKSEDLTHWTQVLEFTGDGSRMEHTIPVTPGTSPRMFFRLERP